MIYLAAISVSLLLALYLQQRGFNGERREWTAERQLLLTRIQHPEFVVATPDRPAVDDSALLHESDEIDRVGEIVGELGAG